MFLDKYIQENGLQTDYPIFDNKDHKDILFPTKDLFLAQYKNTNYNAIDIIVKYLAIENYYGINNYGFYLYNKMQYLRTNKEWEERFKKLIESMERGYNGQSFIETDLNYSIHDGAHRTALSLFYNIKEIPLRLYNTSVYRRDYDLSWFYDNNFNNDELFLIKNKLDELLDKTLEPYYCILWTPSRNLFDEIENKIKKMSEDVKISYSTDVGIEKSKFKEFVYDIYSTDDIKKEKLDMKFNAILNSLQKDKYDLDKYFIRILKLDLKYPDFRVKPLTGLPQSKETMRIKSLIRDEFKKYITDYYYDIIMHVTDNSKQNEDVAKILKNIKGSEL